MAGIIALDVVLMSMLVGFTLTALSHISATWRIRKDFYVAVRYDIEGVVTMAIDESVSEASTNLAIQV